MIGAVATMPKKKADNAEEMEVVKIEKKVLDRARVAFSWFKSQLPIEKRKGYFLQNYLSDCLSGNRSMMDDYSHFIREENKKLGKPRD